MDRLESMAVFVRAAELGSFAATAEQLGITGTMVGLHVRALEQQLGVRLLNRTTRRQSLTDIGALYYERCKQILHDVADAEASAAELQAIPRGRLRIATPVSFGVHALAPACADYLADNPQVTIDLRVSDQAVDLVEEGFDAAIRIGTLADSTMLALPLTPYRSIICAAPAYLERHGVPKRPENLSQHACLGFAHPVASQSWQMRGPEGDIAVPVSLVMTANNGEALRMAALNGTGIITQPEILLARDLQAGRLIQILPEFAPPPRPMHILTSPHRRRTPKIQSFVDFVMARFGRS